MATCTIYICLTVVVNEHLLAYSLSYIIILRLWRLRRFYHGSYVVYKITKLHLHTGTYTIYSFIIYSNYSPKVHKLANVNCMSSIFDIIAMCQTSSKRRTNGWTHLFLHLSVRLCLRWSLTLYRVAQK